MTSEYKTTAEQRRAARSWQAANPFRFMWTQTRARAAREGHVFAITEQHVERAWPVDGRCPALGIALVKPGTDRGTTKRGPRDDSATLDRIDSRRGYEPDNIAIISWRANRIKDAAKASELASIATWLMKREQLQALL